MEVESGIGKWKMKNGSVKCNLKVKSGSKKRKWNSEIGKQIWKVESKKWKWKVKVENGKWKVESGSGKRKQKVKNEKWECKV